MAFHDFEPYFPNRPPTWAEVISSVAAVGILLPYALGKISSLPTVAAGFILFILALSFTSSYKGLLTRVEDWFHRIGFNGRVLVIVAAFVIVQLIAELAPVSRVLLNDVATGVLLATVLYFAVFLARERTVSGWTASREPAE